MSGCRWDSEVGDYVADGEICRTDEYGDPTNHCTSRRTCSNHIGWGEKTCARCIGRTRMDLRRLVELAPLAMTQALVVGVDSEAAMLAGPGVDPRSWSGRRVAMMSHLLTWTISGYVTGDGRRLLTEQQYLHARATMEDDDEFHPYVVLTRWHLMLAEDYGHPLPDRMTVVDSGAYLERTLGRMAQDDEQDFPLFAREIRACRNHHDAVLRNSGQPERGAPCPDCATEGHVVRMSRVYGHWCVDVTCTQQFHYSVVVDRETGEILPDTSGDWWRCPRGHERNHEDYTRWVEERRHGVAS